MSHHFNPLLFPRTTFSARWIRPENQTDGGNARKLQDRGKKFRLDETGRVTTNQALNTNEGTEEEMRRKTPAASTLQQKKQKNWFFSDEVDIVDEYLYGSDDSVLHEQDAETKKEEMKFYLSVSPANMIPKPQAYFSCDFCGFTHKSLVRLQNHLQEENHESASRVLREENGPVDKKDSLINICEGYLTMCPGTKTYMIMCPNCFQPFDDIFECGKHFKSSHNNSKEGYFFLGHIYRSYNVPIKHNQHYFCYGCHTSLKSEKKLLNHHKNSNRKQPHPFSKARFKTFIFFYCQICHVFHPNFEEAVLHSADAHLLEPDISLMLYYTKVEKWPDCVRGLLPQSADCIASTNARKEVTRAEIVDMDFTLAIKCGNTQNAAFELNAEKETDNVQTLHKIGESAARLLTASGSNKSTSGWSEVGTSTSNVSKPETSTTSSYSSDYIFDTYPESSEIPYYQGEANAISSNPGVTSSYFPDGRDMTAQLQSSYSENSYFQSGAIYTSGEGRYHGGSYYQTQDGVVSSTAIYPGGSSSTSDVGNFPTSSHLTTPVHSGYRWDSTVGSPLYSDAGWSSTSQSGLSASGFTGQSGSYEQSAKSSYSGKEIPCFMCDHCHYIEEDETKIKRHLQHEIHYSASEVMGEDEDGSFVPKSYLRQACFTNDRAKYRTIIPICPSCFTIYPSVFQCAAHYTSAHDVRSPGAYALEKVSEKMLCLSFDISCHNCRLSSIHPLTLLQHFTKTGHFQLDPIKNAAGEPITRVCFVCPYCNEVFYDKDNCKIAYSHVENEKPIESQSISIRVLQVPIPETSYTLLPWHKSDSSISYI